MDVALRNDRVHFGSRFSLSLHRTLRIPDDGRVYPLPPGFGLFPLRPLDGARVPGARVGGSRPPEGGALELIVPIYQREALWLGFSAAPWKPSAVKVIAGGINAVTGLPDDGASLSGEQDYLVCPDQPWLDGWNAGGGVIRQFVAMPLGLGYAVEAGAGLPEKGGIDVVVFDPLPGCFPDAPPPEPAGPARPSRGLAASEAAPREMALGASGRMRQKIHPDRYGPSVWDPAGSGRARIHLIDSLSWLELTGQPIPPTPIDAASYTAAGLPWFDFYEEGVSGVSPSGGRRLKTVTERDLELGVDADERPVEVRGEQVTQIHRREEAP